MEQRYPKSTICLAHQLAEDQTSPIGLVCRQCKRRLYTQPPAGVCRSFWESQPAAYTLEREPCFVYSLMWDDYRIRSLHPPESNEDLRGERVKSTTYQAAPVDDPPPAWLEDFRIERDWLGDEDDA